LDLAFRALRHGVVAWSQEMQVTHPPRPITIGKLIRRGRMTASEVDLLRRHPHRYPGARGVPVRLRVIVRLARRWGQLGWRDRARLVRSPKRLARFSAISLGQLVVAGVAVARASMPRETSR
jgi:hypothetical protein